MYTGLGEGIHALGGRNVSLTAGVDLGVVRIKRFVLSVEGRGTYPLYRGHVDGQESLLGGVRVDHTFASSKLSHLLVYGNVLAGRGEEHYVDGGFLFEDFLYASSTTTVYSAGLGFEVAVGHHFSYKAEAEVQHWNTPVTTAGVIYSKQGSAGIVYRFGSGKAH